MSPIKLGSVLALLFPTGVVTGNSFITVFLYKTQFFLLAALPRKNKYF
jgi:hypothetical protein